MKQTMSHGGADTPDNEMQFQTPFGYMFQMQAETTEGTLPQSNKTGTNLTTLADAMGTPATSARRNQASIPIFQRL